MAGIRQVSFASPVQPQSPLVQALAPRDPRSMIALQALQEGTSTAPVQSVGEGVVRLAQGALGGFLAGQDRRRADETSARLADAVLGAMPEAQRSGPMGQMLAAALRDPNVGPAILPGLLTSITRQPEAPAGYRFNPDGSLAAIPGGPEDPRVRAATAAAGRDPLVTVGDQVYERNALMQGNQPQAGQPEPAQAQPGQTDEAGAIQRALVQLRQGESSGNPNAVGPETAPGSGIRASGLYQFTPATWQDVLAARPDLAQRISPANINNPQAQEIMAPAYAQILLRDNRDLIGRQVNGVPVTPEAIIRGGWLGGSAGVRRYVESNGQYNPQDINGTRISDYFNGTARNFRSAQVAQAGQTATDAQPQQAAPVRQVPDLLPRSDGSQPSLPSPETVREPLMTSQRPGALIPGPTNNQRMFAREVRNSHLGQQEVKNAQRVSAVLHSMEDAAGRDSAASDLNLVYGLMTILDPSSVVREGEVTMVRSTQGLPAWVVGMYDRLSSGNAALQPQDRERIMVEARSRAAGQMQAYNYLRDNDESFLRSNDFNPNAVLGRRLTLPQPRQNQQQQQPTVGGQAVSPDDAVRAAEEELRRRRQGVR